jgi:hypothetical protein
VPDIAKNIAEFRALPISKDTQALILSGTALEIWPQ